MLGWKHEGFRYSCKRPLSLDATVPQASLSITPVSGVEQWIVANLCSRSADVVLRLVEPNPGPAGWRTRSEGRSRVGTTDEM